MPCLLRTTVGNKEHMRCRPPRSAQSSSFRRISSVLRRTNLFELLIAFRHPKIVSRFARKGRQTHRSFKVFFNVGEIYFTRFANNNGYCKSQNREWTLP